MTQEELKRVFNALKQCNSYAFAGGLGLLRATAHRDALAILDKALAQPEQEPVKMVAYNCLCGRTMKFESVQGVIAPQREWVWLKDEEIWSLITRIGSGNSDVNPLTILADVRAVEFRIHMKNSDVKQEPQRTEQEKHWDALGEKQAAAFDRDGRMAYEDITVRAVHKVMAEFEAQPEQKPVADDFFKMIADRNPKAFPQPQLKQEQGEPVAWRTFDGEGQYEYRTYEENENYADDWNKRNPNHKGWVDKLYTYSQRTDKERILQLIKELRPAIKSLEGMGKGKTTDEWFDILVKDIEEKTT